MLGNLHVRLGNVCPCENDNLLAEVRFETGAHDAAAPRRWPLGLAALNGAAQAEHWFVDSPVDNLELQGFHVSHSRDWAWLGREWDCQGEDIVAMARDMFLGLHAAADTLGKPHVARLWVIIPQIHHGEGDDERYKQFCSGRHQAYQALGISAPNYPAATVIGSYQGPLRLHVLLCTQGGQTLENPQQTSAYHYPRIYGPSSPSFSRALRLDRHTFVSGTAAIRGADSQHHGDVIAQLRTIQDNLQALCGQAQQPWHEAAAYGRVYLRTPQQHQAVRDESLRLWPGSADWPVLHGDICREELLCEVETGL